jgi:dihydrofolate reductase
MKVILIAAIGKNNEIGLKNDLIWPIKQDLLRFKAVTKGNIVVMGSKTYKSIGESPLRDRLNLVMSRWSQKSDGVVFIKTVDEAFAYAKEFGKDLFVIGGAEIYKLFLPHADELQLTLIDAEAEADTYFPHFKNRFSMNNRTNHTDEKTGINYSFTKWFRI